MKKLHIAVVYGGISNERDISIMSGKNIINTLDKKKYKVFPVEITKKGSWKLHDKKISKTLTVFDDTGGHIKSDLKKFDALFLGLHGRYAEDGTIQAILDLIGVPYTGSGVMASAIGMNKIKTIEFASAAGIRVPKFLEIQKGFAMKEVRRAVGFPLLVKPNNSGSSVGIAIVKGERALKKAIMNALQEDSRVFVEEYIQGREFTCAVIGNAGTRKVYALSPIEIRTKEQFFDYHAKYFSKETEEICPAPISNTLTKDIQEKAIRIHEMLECKGVTRSDFILRGNDFYFLEINTLPGMTNASLCPKAAAAYGMSFSRFLDVQIECALR